MKRENILLSALLLPIVGLPTAHGQNSSNRKAPNIIAIMCDDLGYEDVSFNICERPQGQIHTPNIDRIANEGAKCTSGYATYSVSGPSRAGFITGRYPQRFGYERNPVYDYENLHVGVPLEEMTIAESLREVGYKSCAIGKWHIGAHPLNHPNNRGFDHFFGHLGGGHQYFVKNLTIEDSYSRQAARNSYDTYILRNNTPIHPDDMSHDYLTYCFTDEAISFVEQNKDEQFFIFLAYNAPHGPLQAPDGTTATRRDSREVRDEVYRKMVAAVDQGVGELLDKLEELNIDDNTLIFFFSDNGGPEHKGANNGVLRGGKSDIHEGGFRVPYAVRWPGVIEPQTFDAPVSLLDVFATASALAKSPTANTLDGVNLIPYFTGEKKGAVHDAIYLRKWDERAYAIRVGDYKLQRRENEDGEITRNIYNITENISEDDSNNPVAGDKKRISKLEKALNKWEKGLILPAFGQGRRD